MILDQADNAGAPGTLDDLFRRAGVRRPEALALVDPENRERFTDGPPRRLTFVQTDRAISGVAARLRNDGYAQVMVEGVALVDVHTQQAALKLAVRLGPQYRFGDIQIDTGGDTAIAPAWIWDQVRLAIPEGDFFSD